MKKLFSITALILCFMGCKKQEAKVAATIPAPFYFQLLNSEGTPISYDNIKIWYFKENGDKSYLPHIKPLKMKSGKYEFISMNQEITSLSVFKKITNFYMQANEGVVNSVTIKIDDLGYNDQDIYRFSVLDVKFNGKEIKIDDNFLPGLWLLNK